MGIKGLLKALSSVQESGDISEFSGATVAVDASTWLHRFAYSCAPALVLGQPTSRHIDSCVNLAKALRDGVGVQLVFVFDGSPLPAKERTCQKRQMTREAAKAKALELYRQPKKSGEAFRYFQQAVEITPEIAHQLLVALQHHGFECLVAPFEADAQLGYLCEIGYAAATISVDSDLALHGCGIVLYSIEASGDCRVLRKTAIKDSGLFEESLFSEDNFLMCCILAGCDYASSLRGVGIHKAAKIVSRSGPDISEVLRVISGDLENKKLKCEVPEDYQEQLQRALFAFKYQWVFDPRNGGKLLRKQELPEDLNAEIVDKAVGSVRDLDLVKRACLGHVNPATLEPFILMLGKSLKAEAPVSENEEKHAAARTTPNAGRRRQPPGRPFPWVTSKGPRKRVGKQANGGKTSIEPPGAASIIQFLNQSGPYGATETRLARCVARPASVKRRARDEVAPLDRADGATGNVELLQVNGAEDIAAFVFRRGATAASRRIESSTSLTCSSEECDTDSLDGSHTLLTASRCTISSNSSPSSKRPKRNAGGCMSRSDSCPKPWPDLGGRCAMSGTRNLFIDEAAFGAMAPEKNCCSADAALTKRAPDGNMEHWSSGSGHLDPKLGDVYAGQQELDICCSPEFDVIANGLDEVDSVERDPAGRELRADKNLYPAGQAVASKSVAVDLESFRFASEEKPTAGPIQTHSSVCKEAMCEPTTLLNRRVLKSFVTPRRRKRVN